MKKHLTNIGSLCLALAGTGFAQKIIPNHAIANLVLGQTDFVTAAPGTLPSSFSLANPSSVVVDPVSRKVFVMDRSNGRVLRYPNAASLTNGAGAEAVFGKASFGETIVSTNGQQGLSGSGNGLFLDRKGRLWLADESFHRVICYEAAAYRSSHPHADRVFGQPDFATTSLGTTAAKMRAPVSVWVDGADRLWVVEFGNHRVLRFDSISTKANGASADGVLGQSTFTANTSGPGAAKFNSPIGLCVSPSGTLFVADRDNNRVMRFANAATLGNGANATGVLGQLDFIGTNSGLSSSRFSSPIGASITPTDDLWVNDRFNNRVLRFGNASTTASGSAANGVVGQADFNTNTGGTTARKISLPLFAPFVDTDGSLWLPDFANHRVLRFPADTTLPLLGVTPAPPKTTTGKSLLIKGTAGDTYGIARVTYRINGGAPRNATGTTAWQFTAALRKGNNTITINAVDSVGNLSLTRTVKIRRK
jgi:sugar lactone lactonase YvrE